MEEVDILSRRGSYGTNGAYEPKESEEPDLIINHFWEKKEERMVHRRVAAGDFVRN
jgi:hypothetical protein